MIIHLSWSWKQEWKSAYLFLKSSSLYISDQRFCSLKKKVFRQCPAVLHESTHAACPTGWAKLGSDRLCVETGVSSHPGIETGKPLTCVYVPHPCCERALCGVKRVLSPGTEPGTWVTLLGASVTLSIPVPGNLFRVFILTVAEVNSAAAPGLQSQTLKTQRN